VNARELEEAQAEVVEARPVLDQDRWIRRFRSGGGGGCSSKERARPGAGEMTKSLFRGAFALALIVSLNGTQISNSFLPSFAKCRHLRVVYPTFPQEALRVPQRAPFFDPA
jgi:hypothetical protein